MALVGSYLAKIIVRPPTDERAEGDPPIKPLTIEQLTEAIAEGVQRVYWDVEPGAVSVVVNVTAERTDV